MSVNFNEFFNILYTDTGEVYPYIRRSRLDIWQLPRKCLVIPLMFR